MVIIALWGLLYTANHQHCWSVCGLVRAVCIRWVWQFLLTHFVSVFGHSPVHVVVCLCARFWTCLHAKQGIALSFIIVITGIMTSVGDERYSTARRKPETVTAGFGTGSQGGDYWEEEWPSSLPHQYSSEWMYSFIRCLLLRCSVVRQCCKQQQDNLNVQCSSPISRNA